MEKEKYKKSRTKIKAEWLDDSYRRKCSNCDSITCWTDDEGTQIPSNFCPNCGARIIERGM